MPIMFNTILREASLPLEDVILLRHQDQRAARGRTPYELWRDNIAGFHLYHSHHRIGARQKFSRATHWATFVGTPAGETLFVGLYTAHYRGILDKDTPMPHRDGVDKAGDFDVYDVSLHDLLSDLIGKLYIDWGPGTRAWVQRADRKDKPIAELRTAFKERAFPGFLNFSEPLSALDGLPSTWEATLRSSKGVYILTCPKTKEQYVGSATGEYGFWQRWEEYARTGHGGNIALKSREPSDYQVSILQVAGTDATTDDIINMEEHWKRKLQSKQMGLNR
jgi:hypothetical protein